MLAAAFEGYIGFFVIAAISLLIGAGAVFASSILGPKHRTRVKEEPYECGVDPLQETARERYSVHFYLVAILFILFDLETVFLFPWAAAFKHQVGEGVVRVVLVTEVLLFVAVLFAGLVYVWKRRGLEWD